MYHGAGTSCINDNSIDWYSVHGPGYHKFRVGGCSCQGCEAGRRAVSRCWCRTKVAVTDKQILGRHQIRVGVGDRPLFWLGLTDIDYYYYYSTMALANKDDPISNGVIYCYEVCVDLGALNRSRWRRE